MNHPVPEELISAYFDGEVSPDERGEIERSLESSSELRQQLDETSKLSALLHSFPRESAPRELAANVQKQVNAATQPALAQTATSATTRRNMRREWTAFGAGMLATIASLMMFVSFNQSQFTTNSPTPLPWGDAPLPQVTLQPKPAAQEAFAEAHPTFSNPNIETEPSDPSRQLQRNLSLSTEPNVARSKMNDHSTPTELSVKLKDVESLAQNSAPMVANDDFTGTSSNSIQPQIQNEFLSYLANGDVIVSKVADPSNTVAVVYFTVVDIERGSNELKVLFQKRSLQEVEVSDDVSLGKEIDAKDRLVNQQPSITKNDLSKKRDASRADEFQVFFARAPGDQLADTIGDLVKNHPDIFRNWTPQPPIELPVASQPPTEGIVAENNVLADANNKAQGNSLSQMTDETTTVNAEAEMAVGVLMARNSSVNANGDFYYVTNTTRPLSVSNSIIGNTSSLGKNVDFVTPPIISAASSPSGPENKSPRNNTQNSANSGQGYFRVSRQHQPQVALQQAVPVQNKGTPLVASSMMNANGSGLAAFGSGMGRNAMVNTNNDSRNPRLVRMLFVLKSEQATTNPTP